MAHMRQQILEAMQAELIAQNVASGRVVLDTTYNVATMPAVRLVQASDEFAGSQSIPHVHRNLQVDIELFATDPTNVAAPLNQLDATVYGVLMTHNWRPASVDDIRQTSVTPISNVEDADQPTAGMVATYTIRYRHNETDAEAFT